MPTVNRKLQLYMGEKDKGIAVGFASGVAQHLLKRAGEIGDTTLALEAIELYQKVSPKTATSHAVIQSLKEAFDKGEKRRASNDSSRAPYFVGGAVERALSFYKDEQISKRIKPEDKKILSELEARVQDGERRGWRIYSIVTIAGLALGSLFFLQGITGNTITNISNSTANIIGSTLFILGLVGAFFWVKKK